MRCQTSPDVSSRSGLSGGWYGYRPAEVADNLIVPYFLLVRARKP